MAYTQAQYDALTKAIASGARSVSYEGKMVSYGSLDDMLRVQNIIARALGLAPSSSATVLAAHDRGFPAPFMGNDGWLTGW